MEIATSRFLLRDFVEEDSPAFAAYHADPRSLDLYGDEQATPGHADELIALFRRWAAERPRQNYQLAIIQRKEPQVLLGCCGLRCAGSEPGTAELGLELAPQYWGRYGYAIEVMRALADFGFGCLELNEIYGETVSANARMARLASSFGAVAMPGPTPAWMLAKGWHRVEWRVTRGQWESGRPSTRTSRTWGAGRAG